MTNEKPIVQMRDVFKKFGKIQALGGIDLDIFPERSSACWGLTGRARARC